MAWKVLAIISGLFGVGAGMVTIAFLIMVFNGNPEVLYSVIISATTTMICMCNAITWWQS